MRFRSVPHVLSPATMYIVRYSLFIVHLIIILNSKLLILNCSAQQTSLSSLSGFNHLLINPAFAGNKNEIQTCLTYRNYLTGIEGAPTTQTLTIHAPIQSKYLGVGVKVIHETIGVANQIDFEPVVSYYLGLGQGRLAFALEGGFLHENISWQDLIKTNPVDNAIPQLAKSKFFPDAGFGMFYNTSKFFVGFSVTHLIRAKFNYSDIKSVDPGFLAKHYYIEAGYNYALGKYLSVEPSLLLKKAIAAPVQIDIGAKCNFKNLVSAGIFWRSGDALYFPVRLMINNKYSIAYAYDLRVSKLATYSQGSHEIMLNFNYQLLEPARKKVINPRYYF